MWCYSAITLHCARWMLHVLAYSRDMFAAWLYCTGFQPSWLLCWTGAKTHIFYFFLSFWTISFMVSDMSCYLFRKYCRVWNSSSSIIQTKKLSLFLIFAFLLRYTLLFGVFLKRNQCFPITELIPLLHLVSQIRALIFCLCLLTRRCILFFRCYFLSFSFTRLHSSYSCNFYLIYSVLLLIPFFFLQLSYVFIPLRYVMIHDCTFRLWILIIVIIPYTCGANGSHLSQQYLLLLMLLLLLLLFIFDYSLHGSPCLWIYCCWLLLYLP